MADFPEWARTKLLRQETTVLGKTATIEQLFQKGKACANKIVLSNTAPIEQEKHVLIILGKTAPRKELSGQVPFVCFLVLHFRNETNYPTLNTEMPFWLSFTAINI